MSTPIIAKFGTSTTLTITLASLAFSATVGRASTMIDNSTTAAQMIRVYYSIMTGTTPTVNTPILIYLTQGDASSPNIRTDNASGTDGTFTVVTAKLVDVINVSATSNVAYNGSFLVRNPGPNWGVAVVNNTGANLNSTGGNHVMRYVTEDQTT